eukprot:TRINITY_DN583_c1_g2_i1.p1 TRINITY_DN583_c1_g2~~TRINITY_DN583_c1_g2_i1.p1  ORF type:complete len:144 (+),score=18.33 TRINITY_DN583_c1_g2_i1:35-466(+)
MKVLRSNLVLDLLLHAELVGVTALLLAAVSGAGVKTSEALAADLLLAVDLAGKLSKSGGKDTTTKTKNEVKGGLLLDVVVGEGAAILELLAGEDEALLFGGDTLLILDLLLNRVDRIGGLDIEGDGLTHQGLHEDLHRHLVTN